MIVGGGGSGGYGNQGGGGGGGEVLYTPDGIAITPGTTKTIKIGAGGAATAAPANIPGNNGGDSVFDGITAHGGGAGGSGGPSSLASVNAGVTGGSAGGGNRFSNINRAPTKTTASGFISLANAGGKGAGKPNNNSAGPSECAPYGAGGGGGGAMTAGGDASASCSDSSTAGSVNVIVGAGGAGAYLMNRCLGGGGASVGTLGDPANAGSLTIVQAPKTPCKHPVSGQDISGTFSGGGSGSDSGSGVDNTGGGGSGALFLNGRPKGGSGVVLIAYDPTNPPVKPVITRQPDSSTIFSQSAETLSVGATINDGGVLTYQWQSAAAGSSTFSNIAGATMETYTTPSLLVASSGIQYRVVMTNTKSARTTTNTSAIATITVNRRTSTLSLSYPDSNTARFSPGETLTPTFSSNSDNVGNIAFTAVSNASICTINSTTGVISLFHSGQCVVRATIAASDRYGFVSIYVTINVRNPLQTVRWASLPNLVINSSPITLGASPGYALATGETATGAGSISYSVSSCSSFSISSAGVITPFALGSCAIKALQGATADFEAGFAYETLTIVANVPNAPFINSVSSSGGSTSTSGAITASLTSGAENGSSITRFVIVASPVSGPAISESLTASSGTRNVTVTGLTLGTSYTLSAYVVNNVGQSSPTTFAAQVTPAGIPYGVSRLSAIPGDTNLTIAYTPPSNLNGGTWDRYQYFITPTGSPFSDTPTAISTTQSDSSFIFTGLTNGTAYDVKVVALTSANGTASSANTTLLNLIPAVAPAAPTITISQISSTSARVDWTPGSDGGSAITQFLIAVTRNSVSQSCYVNVATKYCTLTGLSALDDLRATASAVNLIGTSPQSSQAALVISSIPLAPTSITATAGDTSLSIAFSQPNSGDSIIAYEYSLDGNSFQTVATSSSPIVITGLTNGNTYNLFIRAVGLLYGAGAISETITATPSDIVPPVPPAPSVSSGSSDYSSSTQISIVAKVEETVTVIILIESVTVTTASDTPTSTVETQSVEVKPKPLETVTVRSKFNLRLEEPFRNNSYFINAAANKELSDIVKRFKNMKVISVVAIGYSTPSLVNPYPSQLGLWRANAVVKKLKSLGMKGSFSIKYGGLFYGSRIDARKVRITITTEKNVLR